MHEFKKCAIPHLCYYSRICPKWRVDNKCALDKARTTYTPNESIDMKRYTPEQDYITDIKRRFELGVDEA